MVEELTQHQMQWLDEEFERKYNNTSKFHEDTYLLFLTALDNMIANGWYEDRKSAMKGLWLQRNKDYYLEKFYKLSKQTVPDDFTCGAMSYGGDPDYPSYGRRY